MAASFKKLEQAVDLLKSLAHPVRLAILCHLLEHGETCVGDLVASAGKSTSQSHVSQFLSAMKRDGLVKSRKDAQTVYYCLHSARAEQVVRALAKIYCAR